MTNLSLGLPQGHTKKHGFVSTKATFLWGISHYWKRWWLASEIVVAVSEENISQGLYFQNSFFRFKQLTMLICCTRSPILISSNLLLHDDVKSSEQLQLNRAAIS